MNDKYNPNSPRFNWNALAQRNEDVTKQSIAKGRAHRDGRDERIMTNFNKSERHQAAMHVAQRKLRGDTRFQHMSVKEMMKGELGERY